MFVEPLNYAKLKSLEFQLKCSLEKVLQKQKSRVSRLIIMIGKILIQMIFPSYLKSGISGSGEMRVATSSIIQSF